MRTKLRAFHAASDHRDGRPRFIAAHDTRTGNRGPTGNRGATGSQGPTNNRGAEGPQGLPGPVGPSGLQNHRLDTLPDKVDAIFKELETRFARFAQMQLQLDGLAQALGRIESQRASTERLTPTAEREATAK